MKLKPVISPNLPIRLAKALIDPQFDAWYKRVIVKGHLHVAEIQVAGHYIQWPDFMVESEDGKCGIEVSFSKLSARIDRSGLDFINARQAIQAKLIEVIEMNLPKGRDCELFVGSQTNKPIEGPGGTKDTLHELDYRSVLGNAEPDAELDQRADYLSLKPLREPWFRSNPA